ncbi:MAG: RNA 2',3'-cyclic phosphodiesterase [Anaerolineaceae bacterium]|nr:RNA 2',3'-cyclic phosphodiesterase [Anaerolineaceae bacterium]
MNNPLRLFIAIELSIQIQQALVDLIHQISPLADRSVRWVTQDHLHLTLKFLGDTPTTLLPGLNTVLAAVANAQRGFELSAQGCGVFPNPNRPRVLWAGVTCPPELSNLQKSLEMQLMPLGYKPEDRPFSPHLTLGRVSDSADAEKMRIVVKALQEHQKSEFGSVNIQKFTLFQSTLTPKGPLYTPLKRFSFAEKA